LAFTDAELVLVGRGVHDGPLLRAYDGLYRVERDVHARAEMARIYADSDVCCLPSLSDAFGHVLLEALACGTPVIGTPNTAAPDLVTPGENGFIVPIRDVDALAGALAWCYEHRDALAEMRAQARRCAERFSWSAFRRTLIAQLV
ncbi:MAG TPA: glycosyltransferase family 4 protein, partial [Gemmatirosa sp.]